MLYSNLLQVPVRPGFTHVQQSNSESALNVVVECMLHMDRWSGECSNSAAHFSLGSRSGAGLGFRFFVLLGLILFFTISHASQTDDGAKSCAPLVSQCKNIVSHIDSR